MQMILYHFSDASYSELLPAIGPRRQDSEDSRAKGPVVWLTDSPTRAPGIETQALFRHEVEIDENDPFLTKDESAERLKKGWRSMVPAKADAVRNMETLYFYTKQIQVKAVVPLDTKQIQVKAVVPLDTKQIQVKAVVPLDA